MPPELAEWIPPAVIVGVMLYLHRSSRQQFEARMDRVESRIGGVEKQIGELRERMAPLEGLLEGLREAVTRRNVA